MKLPITDKTLVMIFEMVEGILAPFEISPRSMKEAVWPEYQWFRIQYEKKMRRKNFYQFLHYLKKKGYIQIADLKTHKTILLTQKGIDKVLRAKLKLAEEEAKRVKLKKRKDKKYLMIVFDIPETKRVLRDQLREYLRALGFVLFQKSIWISPYDVKERLEKIITQSRLEKYVHLFLIEKIKI